MPPLRATPGPQPDGNPKPDTQLPPERELFRMREPGRSWLRNIPQREARLLKVGRHPERERSAVPG